MNSSISVKHLKPPYRRAVTCRLHPRVCANNSRQWRADSKIKFPLILLHRLQCSSLSFLSVNYNISLLSLGLKHQAANELACESQRSHLRSAARLWRFYGNAAPPA